MFDENKIKILTEGIKILCERYDCKYSIFGCSDSIGIKGIQYNFDIKNLIPLIEDIQILASRLEEISFITINLNVYKNKISVDFFDYVRDDGKSSNTVQALVKKYKEQGE